MILYQSRGRPNIMMAVAAAIKHPHLIPELNPKAIGILVTVAKMIQLIRHNHCISQLSKTFAT
jgi:hypothetical protein